MIGFDGEAAAEHPCHPDLARLTSSALNSIEGEPFIEWWLFDLVTPETILLPYEIRLRFLEETYLNTIKEFPIFHDHLKIIPWVIARDLQELKEIEIHILELEYEGVIIRDPKGRHKQGRSTVREGGLLRIKRFVDFEFIIDGFEEASTNTNEAIVNPLGRTERISHQANKIPKGMIGTLLQDIELSGVPFEIGHRIKVGAGRPTHIERKFYFQNPDQIIGKIGKASFFPKGIKDELRFPIFKSFRMIADMG